MLKLKSVSMKNFLSIGSIVQTVNLDTNALTLILGNNTDAGAENSRNGVGKTSLVQAIIYALYGEPLADIKQDNLVNSINNKGMLVTIDFERDGIDYRIERGRKPNVLRFFINSKEKIRTSADKAEDEAKGKNSTTQDDITEVIGMSHELFQHIVAMNTYTTPFLRLKPGPMREIIEELLGMTILSKRDAIISENIKTSKGLIRDEDTRIKATNDSNALISLAIQRAEKDRDVWAITHNSNIEKLAAQIEELCEIDFEDELKKFDLLDEWNSASKTLLDKRKELLREKMIHTETVDRLRRELSKVLSEASATTDHQITRLRTEQQRCLTEASKDCSQAVARLESEIARCELEAAKTCDALVDRLALSSQRMMDDADHKRIALKAKTDELALLVTQMESSDGHSCSTCGQGLAGTDHLEKVVAALAVKADHLAKSIEREENNIAALEKDAAALLTEISVVEENHRLDQAALIAKSETLRAEIAAVIENHEAQQQDWIVKAEYLANEIGAAEQALAARKVAMQEDTDRLTGELEAAESTKAATEKQLESVKDDISFLGEQPKVEFVSREEVWKLRETRDAKMRDLEREVEKENPYESNVASLKSTVQEINYDYLEELQVTLKHEEFLHKVLTAKDSFIRKRIIDKNVTTLNRQMNKYLDSLKLPHEVIFKPDLSVEITLLGREYDFDQLSRGEMNRVTLSLSWAFRDLWESRNTSINLFLIDELFDSGLDQSGTECAVEVMKHKAQHGKSVFLVSHKESLVGSVDKILMVHKEDQFTRFEDFAEFVSA